MANFVKKLVANFEVRTEVPSSQEEFEQFLSENVRPDFDDEAIIAVKFVFSETEDFSNPEESSWFISPSYVEELHDADADVDFTEAEYAESYGPRLAAEIPPEILLIHINNTRCVLELYDKFHLYCLRTDQLNLPIKEKINKFVEFANSEG